jgi:hypothetical protein
MFIESATNSITRAPAERNVSANGKRVTDYVSLLWSEEKCFGGRGFYKHLAPNGAKSKNVLLHFWVESANDKSLGLTTPQTAYFAEARRCLVSVIRA